MAGMADIMRGGGGGPPGMPPGGGGMGGGMGVEGGGGQMAMVFQLATQILGRPPKDMQEAMDALFSTQPTDGMGQGLEQLMGKPPQVMPGIEAMPPEGMPQQMPQAPMGMGSRMPQRRY